MSKQGATSSHFRAAKEGAEIHNRREKDLYYVRQDLTRLNQTWEAKDFISVKDAKAKVAAKYYDSHITGKGTHKHLPKNAEPIHETAVVISPTTTMDQLKDYARRIHDTWGYTPLGIYMHLDEGHAKAMEHGRWIPNLHAHMVFDTTDADGNSLKPLSARKKAEIREKWEKKEAKVAATEGREPRTFIEPDNFKRPDFDLMQDLAAKALGMDRGQWTGRKGLSDVEYKLQKESQELDQVREAKAKEQANLEQVQKDTADEQDKKITLQKENAKLRQDRDSLTEDVTDLRKTKAKLSTGTGTGAKVAAFFGVGPEAKLRERLNDLQKSIPTQVAKAKAEGKKEASIEAETIVINDIMAIADPYDTKKHDKYDIGVMIRDAKAIARKANRYSKSYTMWRDLALSMWQGAKAAVAVISRYLDLNHLCISFNASEVATVDKALANAKDTETRKSYGRDLVRMAHADYPGYNDDDTRLSQLNREVDKIAEYRHPCQNQERISSLTR